MATTTFETMRATQITQIEAISPDSFSDVPFRVNRAEMDFRAWAGSLPANTLRRFAIVDLFDYEPPETSNEDVEWIVGTQEVLVAYPDDNRYGGDNRRDKRDVMREDMYAIDNVIGHRGTRNYTDGHAVLDTWNIEHDEGVSILVLTYTFRFWRAV
ncbi:MAG: hypothetical protein ACYTFQ_14140 [Planctomycetota bacterium]|jgi:hypothetical protein